MGKDIVGKYRANHNGPFGSGRGLLVKKAEWIELSVPDSHFRHHFSCPVFLNSNEIIMASSNAESNTDDKEIEFGIYKYNLETGESKLFIGYNEKQMELV